MLPYVYDKTLSFTQTLALASSAGTATASGTNTLASALVFMPAMGKIAVRGIKFRVVTAPATNHTGVTFYVLNGTSTLASAVIGTKTAGEVVDGTAVSYGTGQTNLYEGTSTYTPGAGTSIAVPLGANSLAVLGSGTGLTVTAITTATASAQTVGTFDVEVLYQFIA